MTEDDKLRILIVDDNPINCKVLISSLEIFEQYKLLVAQTGSKAISIAEKALPHLILLDINLPEMNGFEVCEHLKKNPQTRHIPIIFLSALDDITSKIKGFDVGGVDYITKPFYKEEVIKRVETQLKIQQLTKTLQSRNEALNAKNSELVRLIDEISKMQFELQESHEQVTSSINYAVRIQQALLPSINAIKNVLPDMFVLFMPRDIVSGDFFWFGYLHGKIALAAIDCTGHGVPGAIMSVIGYTQIHSIIYESGLTKPDEILNELDSRVRQILKQDHGEVKTQDGMDIVLAIYDDITGVLEFAGASLPLLMVRDNELYEIKGVPVSIGGTFYDEKKFTMHTMEVQKGDIYYLFSDGYQDQFGGDAGRRLTRRRMKEFILENADKSLEDQKTNLAQSLEIWRGEHEQTDDILVMGVRFK